MSDPKIQTVQKIYEAFGRGDVATILDQLTDDVDWASEASSTAAPWYGVHKGKGEVPDFFTDARRSRRRARVHAPLHRCERHRRHGHDPVRDEVEGDREVGRDGAAPLVAVPGRQGLAATAGPKTPRSPLTLLAG